MASAWVPEGSRAGRSYSVNAATWGSAYQASQYPPETVRFATIAEHAPEPSQAERHRIRSSQDNDTEKLQEELLQNYECENDSITSFDSEAKVRTSRETGAKVLIKRILRTSLQAANDAEREINVLCAATDASIPILIESLELKDVIWTVKEYRALQPISQLISLNGPIPEEILRTTLNQLFSGLASLFMAGFAPIQINDKTVCFDNHSQLIITELQYACEYGKEKAGDIYAPTQEKYGEDIYTAPEVFATLTYNARKAVIWSCGVLVYFMATGQTDKLSNLSHPSFDSTQAAQPEPSTPTSRRLSSATKNLTIIHYPSSRLSVPNYVRTVVPKMLAPDPTRRAELIELATRIPKEFAEKVTRPLIELAWLDYKSHVGPYAELYNPDTGGWGNESSASSIYSMVSNLSNPFASLLGRSSRRKSAPVPQRPGSSSNPRW